MASIEMMTPWTVLPKISLTGEKKALVDVKLSRKNSDNVVCIYIHDFIDKMLIFCIFFLSTNDFPALKANCGSAVYADFRVRQQHSTLKILKIVFTKRLVHLTKIALFFRI